MSESRPKLPTAEDINEVSEIAKFYKLTHSDANTLFRILNEWSYAAGFAKGMLEYKELMNEVENERD